MRLAPSRLAASNTLCGISCRPAGLQDIPQSVLEAASLDGASRIQRFRHVIWPLLAPTTTFVATTSMILSFQAFDVVRVMTQGGPVRSTTVFVYA